MNPEKNMEGKEGNRMKRREDVDGRSVQLNELLRTDPLCLREFRTC